MLGRVVKERKVGAMKALGFLCLFSVLISASLPAARAGLQQNQVPAYQFTLLLRRGNFWLQLVANGKSQQIAIPRDWLIPPQEEKDDKLGYVSSFRYGKEVSSFPIGNGQMGLHVSSYEIQAEGSAQAAAGRDVFLIFDPRSSQAFRGGIERGVTKQRVRSQGCFAASAEKYILGDIDGDGLADIGVVKEELQCLPKPDADVDTIAGPFYKQYPVEWYVFRGNGWKLETSLSGKFPEHYLELPLIGIERSPVDFVGCGLWKTCDRAKWPTAERGQRRLVGDYPITKLLTYPPSLISSSSRQ